VNSSAFRDAEQAGRLLDTALSALGDVRDGQFWKLTCDQMLRVGRQLEELARVSYAAQVHLAGGMDMDRSDPHTAAQHAAPTSRPHP